jgi:hypothetical protein
MTSFTIASVALALVLNWATAAGQRPVTPIFNGEDLSGWIPDGSEAEVKAGVLLVREGSGWVRTDRPYGDVVLRLDARLIGRNAEAAIFVHAYPHSDQRRSPPSVGYRIIVKDDRSAGRIVRHDLPGRAPSVPYGTAAPSFADAGAWHRYEIHCTGTSLMVTLDGLPVAALGEVENPGGYLAVQAQRGDVEFRNIELETETYRLSEVATTEPGSGVVTSSRRPRSAANVCQGGANTTNSRRRLVGRSSRAGRDP